MDRGYYKPIVAATLALGFGLALWQAIRVQETVAHFTKPVIVQLSSWLGMQSEVRGELLVIGEIEIPWTADCSEFNVLVVLWVLVLWSWRKGGFGFSFWQRMLLAIPLALVVNVVRVAGIVACRHFYYPAAEPIELHYFIGYLALMPLFPFFVRSEGRRWRDRWIEGVFLGAALCLMVGNADGPGGLLVVASALIVLSISRLEALTGRFGRLWAMVWSVAGVAIALTGMESLWLPWVLVCPWGLTLRDLISPLMLVVLGTVPVFAVEFPWLVVVGMGWVGWPRVRDILSRGRANRAPLPSGGCTRGAPRPAVRVFLSGMLLFPFVSSMAIGWRGVALQPPPGVMISRSQGGEFR